MLTYFNNSKVLKEQLTNMDLPPGTMLTTVDVTSMYIHIQTGRALNQISQYFNRNKSEYQNLPVNAILRDLCLIMISNISVSVIATRSKSKAHL